MRSGPSASSRTFEKKNAAGTGGTPSHHHKSKRTGHARLTGSKENPHLILTAHSAHTHITSLASSLAARAGSHETFCTHEGPAVIECTP